MSTLRPQGGEAPSGHTQDLIDDEQFTAAGVVAFDCWIASEDRHNGNLAFVRNLRIGPVVFDHSHALMGHQQGKAIERLVATIDRPYVGSGCLAPLMSNGAVFGEWARRIKSVAPGTIKEVCRSAGRLGAADVAEAKAAENFLLRRQTRILEYLRADPNALPKVAEWGML
jgi:hypothetical protein